MDDCPYVPPELVRHLTEVYPDRLPSNLLTLSDRDIGALVGEQKILSYLLAAIASQEEEHVRS